MYTRQLFDRYNSTNYNTNYTKSPVMAYRTTCYWVGLLLTWVKANPFVALASKLTNAKANLTMPEGLT